MWMKPGMWQYVDYTSMFLYDVLTVSCCGGWLFVVRRRESCVVNILSVVTLESPIVMNICQNVSLCNI